MLTLYRLLLRLYPAGFRDEYGSALETQFRDEQRAGTLGAVAMLGDVATTAPRERLREIGRDLRYSLRMYLQRPLATTLAVVTLALAIGTATGVFSVVNAVLLRSLPFRDPDR